MVRRLLNPVSNRSLDLDTVGTAEGLAQRGNEGGRAGKAEGSVRTPVTSCNSGFGQTNGLPGDQVHCAQRLGLELHGRLFEAGASRGGRPRTLVLRP